MHTSNVPFAIFCIKNHKWNRYVQHTNTDMYMEYILKGIAQIGNLVLILNG